MLVIFVLIGFGFGSWLSRLPAVRDHLSASTFDMSVYGLCLALGSVVGLLVSGHVIQRLGARFTLALTIALQALALPGAVALILSGWLPVGLVTLCLYGFMFSTADVAMNVSGANAERALGKPRLPLMHGGYSLGIVGAMGLGAAAEALGVPLQLHFIVVVALMAVTAAAALPFLPRDEAAARAEAEGAPVMADPPTLTRPSSPWRDRRILAIGLVALAAGILEGTPSDWLPLALVDGRGFSNEAGALMLGVFFTSVLVVRIAGAAVLERLGRVTTLRVSALCAGVGVLTLVLVPGPLAAIFGTVAWGLGTGLTWPVAIAAAANNPRTAVRGVAAVSALGYASMLIGPMGFGFLGEHLGLLNAFGVALIFAGIIGALAQATREEQPEAGSLPRPR